MENTNQEKQNEGGEGGGFKDYFLPISILIAAVLISGALVFNASNAASDGQSAKNPSRGSGGSASNVAEVTEGDHIRGSIDAQVKIVEYSDLECPFCQRFHQTMKKVMDNYSSDEVAWVYRHLPLNAIHPNAEKAAEASECVAASAGEDAFWSFVDNIFANQDQLGSGFIESAAADVGVPNNELQACLDSDRYMSEIQSEKENSLDAGSGGGTPYSVIISGDQYIPIKGAQPYSKVSQAIDRLLSN